MLGPTATEKRRVFEGHAIFGRLPSDELDALLTHARVEHYPSGREIFAKGSPGRSMMAILAGSVRISALAPTGQNIVLALLHAGEVFGEIALIDGQDRTADATATTDCRLLVLDHRDFVPFLQRRADLCVLFLKLLCQRLRQTDRHVEEAMYGRLQDRMAKALVRMASGAPRVGANGVTLRLSQQELAGIIGATRESVNKQLHIWQEAGVLRLGKRLIEIPELAAIKALA
jgi:CRP/FNR family cyclic AMP-dependent transcriptional regulator